MHTVKHHHHQERTRRRYPVSLLITIHAAMGRLLAPSRPERAASLIEYTLLVALIALVCIVAVTRFGTTVKESGFESISGHL